MTQLDLQLGGGYIYQWECALLLALEYLLDSPLKFNFELHQLIVGFLGHVGAIHLEGETRDQERVDLEDVNLLSADKKIHIQIKAKEAEGERWVPSDPLLAKAFYRFYCNQDLDQDEPSVRFVFLSNRGFNPDLVKLKTAIATGTVIQRKQAEHLFNQVQKYVTKNYSAASPLSRARFNRLLERLTLIEFLAVDAVEANVQAKLQALGIESWQQAYEHFYTRFSKASVRVGGAQVTREALQASLERFSEGLLRLQVPPVALCRLPPDIADFIGRGRELAKVIAHLNQAAQSTGTAVVISAVAGMPGVGKSSLAIHVAHRLKDRFPDAQLYVDLRGVEGQPWDPFDVLGGFLGALGVEDKFVPKDIEGRTGLYRSQMADKQAMVLLDNAHNEAQVRPLLPGSPTCAVLVTSRQPLSALEGATIINLKVMPEDEALELLGGLAGTERVQFELDAAKRIVALCGRLPLAIRIAGGKLRDRPRWNFESYASRLEDERQRLDRLHLGDLDVRASFTLSYIDLDPDEARLFRLLGVLPEPVFTLDAVATMTEAELETTWETLERLVDLQLLESASEERYRFHDLMHLFAQWKLEQEEPLEEQQAAQRRVEQWYLTSSEVHFYAQAAILDRHIGSSHPETDSEMLKAILSVLETREDLRGYFFRSGPSAAWAPILWECGFFDKPPSLEKTVEGYLPRWDVQDYLVSVAAQVPDIVVKVAQSIEGEGWYVSQAIRALCHILAEQVEDLVPRVVGWLDDPRLFASITREVIVLVAHLAQGGRLEATFDLLYALLEPIPSSNLRTFGGRVWGAEAQAKFRMQDYEVGELFDQGLPQLAKLDPSRLVAILQEHLCTAIQLEAETSGSPDFETWSWWRTAIEDTGQDIDTTYREWLLRALRDALEVWVKKDALTVEALIGQYLSDERGILRRLGLHILHRFPTSYKALVVEELRRFENLNDTSIHHEFFMLLQRGFPLLSVPDQEALVAAICDGPPSEQVRELAEWAKENKDVDKEEYAHRYIQHWIQDRLLMLQGYLSGRPAEMLKELNEELGPPRIPPAFTRWSSGDSAARDVAPVSEQELAQMSPRELVEYVQEWHPDPQQPFSPERITYEGLANPVAKVILAVPQKYEGHTAQIALHRPEFAYALLGHIREEKPTTSEDWELGIALCETLLKNRTIRADMTRAFYGWVAVRRAIVSLIKLGVNNEQHRVPANLLPKVRDVLLVLLDDPDPDAETDCPPEGYSSHKDPADIAISAVRSSALLALIEYANLRARIAGEVVQESQFEGPGPKRLEQVVREALTRKLNRQENPSWAVHSVYGRYLSLLFWLDQEWVETHIDPIFPEGNDEDSIKYYVAAWDSYVCFNRFWVPILELLRPKYERAIHNLGSGRITRNLRGPGQHLAVHITSEYLWSGYELSLPAGSQNLIALFFQEAPPQARGSVAWFFWRILGDSNADDRETYWPKIRDVWEWRAKEAVATNHSTDFDDEMRWFAHLLTAAPEYETVASLWPLLEALLPHITRSERRDEGWRAVEEYLAEEVKRDPVRVIRLYRLMHEQSPRPQWYYAREETRKIIEKAAADEDACPDALSLINLLAQQGIHQFRDIYERHKACLTGGSK